MKRVFIFLMLAVSVNSFAELEEISGVFYSLFNTKL